MKPMHHHAQRLAKRLLEAELASTPEEASRVIRKAEKHQKKINKWHRLLGPLFRTWRSE
jgi:hypothetical protein